MFKFLILFICLLFANVAGAKSRPENKYLKKAVQNVEKGDLKNAKTYYLRALAKNPDSYDANLGIGLMLCELLDNHTEALPYLEKALSLSFSDTLKDLSFALAQCYQYKGDFEKAIYFYSQLDGCIDYDNEIDLTAELEKRKNDCRYALEHKFYPKSEHVFVVNAGPSINSDMPEYVPVLTSRGELIFTSKRQDSPREELNYLDGKYYESMYIAQIEEGGFKKPRRYTIPDLFLHSHFLKYHESIVSMSPDGTSLFTFRDNKIYEIKMNERSRRKPRKLLKTINFNRYQNHAYVSRDGKTLFFTSDAAGGYGGNDIYKSVKNEKGEWGPPHNLGPVINTAYDEEAPYLSDDGSTLYFSSRGHAGYGNFDIYKSYAIDTSWSKPANLGEPFNSPGHDIFLVHDSAATTGYFSSSRNGGFGDMDIYKVIYLDKLNRQCPGVNAPQITLQLSDSSSGDYRNRLDVSMPGSYTLYACEWKLNGQDLDNKSATLDYDYKQAGQYTIETKAIALCDTCLNPVIVCLSTTNTFKAPEPIVVNNNTASAADPNVSTVGAASRGGISAAELLAMGFNPAALQFDFNKAELRADALQILGPNIEFLKNHPELRVEIVGHSDSRGPKWANQVMSEWRANSVKRALLKSGVSAAQLVVVKGMGSLALLNNCAGNAPCSEAEHQQNRRVELILKK